MLEYHGRAHHLVPQQPRERVRCPQLEEGLHRMAHIYGLRHVAQLLWTTHWAGELVEPSGGDWGRRAGRTLTLAPCVSLRARLRRFKRLQRLKRLPRRTQRCKLLAAAPHKGLSRHGGAAAEA